MPWIKWRCGHPPANTSQPLHKGIKHSKVWEHGWLKTQACNQHRPASSCWCLLARWQRFLNTSWSYMNPQPSQESPIDPRFHIEFSTWLAQQHRQSEAAQHHQWRQRLFEAEQWPLTFSRKLKFFLVLLGLVEGCQQPKIRSNAFLGCHSANHNLQNTWCKLSAVIRGWIQCCSDEDLLIFNFKSIMEPPAEKARLWRNLPHVQALKVDVHPGTFFTKELC